MFDNHFADFRRDVLGDVIDLALERRFRSFETFSQELLDWLLARDLSPLSMHTVPYLSTDFQTYELAGYNIVVAFDTNERANLEQAVDDLWHWIARRVPLRPDCLATIFQCGFDCRLTIQECDERLTISIDPDVEADSFAFPPTEVWQQLIDALLPEEEEVE